MRVTIMTKSIINSDMGRMKMGTVIGKLDRRYNSIAVGDVIGIEVDGRMVTYTVDSFGGIVKGSDGTRLSPKEWKGEAFEILDKGERKPEFPEEDPSVVTELQEPVPLPPLESLPASEVLETVPPAGVSDMEDEARRAVDEQKEERMVAMENALEEFRAELKGLRMALGCFEQAQRSLSADMDGVVSAVSALRAEAGWLDDSEKGRSLETYTDGELAAELTRRGFGGTVSKIVKVGA